MDIIEGVQGSGKSFFIADYIYNKSDYVLDENYYYKVITNLDGFKFDFYDNAEYLDFQDLYVHLKRCYEIKVKEKGSFEDVISYLIDNDIISEGKKTLIAIDEAQDHFGKRAKFDEVKLFFITQHRHMFMDVYLLTQKYSLLHPDSLILNHLYSATQPSKKLGNKVLTYKQFVDTSKKDESFVKNIYLKKNPVVFDTYTSGDKVVSSSIYIRIVKYLIVLFILAVVVIYFLGRSSFFKNVPDIKDTPRNIVNIIKPVEHIYKPSDFVILKIDKILDNVNIINEKDNKVSRSIYFTYFNKVMSLNKKSFKRFLTESSDKYRSVYYIKVFDMKFINTFFTFKPIYKERVEYKPKSIIGNDDSVEEIYKSEMSNSLENKSSNYKETIKKEGGKTTTRLSV